MRLLVAAVLSFSLAGVPATATGDGAESPPIHTRVFYLDGADARETITLLRVEIQVGRIAELRDRQIVIVSETAGRMELVESVLRERGIRARSMEPHPPLAADAGSDDGSTESRVIRHEGLDARLALVLVRSMYGVREVEAREDGTGLSARAPAAVLDAAEALFRELAGGQPPEGSTERMPSSKSA